MKKTFAPFAPSRFNLLVPSLLDTFLSPARPSLKICGVTTSADAERLVELGVHALGINFWDKSKRFCPVQSARAFLPALKDRILRVGVFVNAEPDLPRQLLEGDLIDLAQFHGDETVDYCGPFAHDRLPFIKAIGVTRHIGLEEAAAFHARGLLLDAHAPELYGGTGRVIDWMVAAEFVSTTPEIPVILAGGITPDNAAEALTTVGPAALDVASGAESAPGVKDFQKVEALLAAINP